jgi:undecaprenyl-diphosphatase
MLSKYTMVIFLPGAYLYGLFSPSHRKRLASLKPYIGVFLGFMLFLPVIVWNAKNGWNSVRHVAFIGGANEKFGIHLKYLGEYLAGQAGMVSPLVFILICFAWVFALRKKFWIAEWIYPYLFFASFPIVAAFGFLSLHSRVEANWPGAGYLAACVLAAAFFSGKSKPVASGTTINLGRKIWPWAVITSYLLTALLLLYVVWPFVPIPARQDRILRETSGWRELGLKANAIMQKMPHPEKTFLFGLQYQEASELAFYTPGNPRTVCINRWSRPNVYDYWWKDEELIGWDAVGVTYGAATHKNRLLQVFEHVEPPIELRILRHRGVHAKSSSQTPLKVFYLYRAYGFKGGLRWVPTDMSDIRTN